jgi:hypothetical protein
MVSKESQSVWIQIRYTDKKVSSTWADIQGAVSSGGAELWEQARHLAQAHPRQYQAENSVILILIPGLRDF